MNSEEKKVMNELRELRRNFGGELDFESYKEQSSYIATNAIDVLLKALEKIEDLELEISDISNRFQDLQE